MSSKPDNKSGQYEAIDPIASGSVRPDPILNLGRPITIGIVIILLFFGGFIGWSAGVSLSSAAIAPGKIMVDTRRKTIQHLEGGIVSKIAVREGASVVSGQVLVELDQTQSRANIALLDGQITAAERQLALLKEEIIAIASLLEEGLAPKTRLLALQRRQAQVRGERQRSLAQLSAAKHVLARSRIRASVAGRIVGLRVHSIGGVVKAGEPLMDIVPMDEELFVEAELSPLDIEDVKRGQTALVRMTGISQRKVRPLKGKVIWISADAVTEQRTGRSYYTIRIELPGDPGKALNGIALHPGMPAEVLIRTGARTFLDTLVSPLLQSLNRSFREQ